MIFDVLRSIQISPILQRKTVFVTSRSDADPRRRVPNEFYENMKPMFLLMRLVGMFPYTESSTGTLNFKLTSVSVLYSVVLYCTSLVGIICCLGDERDVLDEGNAFQKKIVTLAVDLSYSLQLMVPFAHWIEVNKKVKFINSWASLEAEFHRVTGKYFKLELEKKVRASVILVTPVTIFCVFGATLVHNSISALEVAVMAFNPLITYCLLTQWLWLSIVLQAAARQLGAETDKLISCYDTTEPVKIVQYKHLWLQLSKLTQEIGGSMGFTYGGFVMYLFVAEILAVYAFFSRVRGNFTLNSAAIGTSMLYFGLVLHFICSYAEFMTQEVGKKFQDRVQDFLKKFPTTETPSSCEVKYFLEEIYANPPTINFCGYADVNKQFHASLMSQLATYMVVLLQFDWSSDASTNPQSAAIPHAINY